MIWQAIDWSANKGSGEHDFYGAGLLQVIGHIGEACEVHSGCQMPLSTLLIAMTDVQSNDPVLLLKITKRATYVEPTKKGMDVLKVTGRLKVSKRSAQFDIPQQLFAISDSGNYEFKKLN